jgi:nicotinamide-nucleotide amidase
VTQSTSLLPSDITDLAARVLERAKAKGVMIATAESCTGGLVAGALTEIAGSSAVVDRGFVTYSNEAKHDLLGVEFGVLNVFGAVSEPVARAMAAGAVERSRAQLSVAITGIAGPGGGSAEKPVGLVHFATYRAGHVEHAEHRFGDLGRGGIRHVAVLTALRLLEARLAS